MPVGQDGFKYSQPTSHVSLRKGLDMVSSMPTYPCGCPQKMLSTSCGLVIVPSAVTVTTAARKMPGLVAQGKLPEFTSYGEKRWIDGAASALVGGLDAPHCRPGHLKSSQPSVPQFPLIKELPPQQGGWR